MQILTIAGNVGKDAVLRTTQGGDKVLSFSVAVDNGKDSNGNSRPATWYDASVWGKRAEALEQHITKGTKLALSGRPTVREHEGKAYLGISVNELTFQGASQSGERQERRPAECQSQGGGYSAPSFDAMDDDLPFEMPWR